MAMFKDNDKYCFVNMSTGSPGTRAYC